MPYEADHWSSRKGQQQRHAAAVDIRKFLMTVTVLVTGGLLLPTSSFADDCGVSGNLVNNCGFEAGGDFTSWAKNLKFGLLSLVEATGYDRYNSHSGTYFAAVATNQLESIISQKVTDTAGAIYNIGGWYSQISFPSYLDIYWDGLLVGDFPATRDAWIGVESAVQTHRKLIASIYCFAVQKPDYLCPQCPRMIQKSSTVHSGGRRWSAHSPPVAHIATEGRN